MDKHIVPESKNIVESSESWVKERLDLQRDLTIADLSKAGGAVKALANIGKHINEAQAGHNDRLYTDLARIFAVARLLQHDDDAWRAVCDDKLWEEHPRSRPSFKDRSSVWVTSLKLAVGASKEDRKRVSLFKRALQPAFDDKVHPQAVRDLLKKAGGPEELARQNTQGLAVPVLARGSLLICVPPGDIAGEIMAFGPKRKLTFTFLTQELVDQVLHVKPKSVVRQKSEGK